MLPLVVGQSFGLAFGGVVLGGRGALGGAHLLGSLLYGVSAIDFPTYLLVVALLGAAAFIASLIPARRATKVNPTEALRAE